MDVKGFTIADPESREICNTVWVEYDARGFVITFCIANVADAIAKDSIFDKTAKRRIKTIRNRNGSRPMLPRRFGEGQCSLLEGEYRPVIALRMRLDHGLEISGLPILGKATVKNLKIFSEFNEDYKSVRLAKKVSVLLDGDPSLEAPDIIREFATLTNKTIARFCIEKNIPVPFVYYKNKKAVYSSYAKECYVHSTNPISRFVDLVVQRQLIGFLNGRNLAYDMAEIDNICEHLNIASYKKSNINTRKQASDFEPSISQMLNVIFKSEEGSEGSKVAAIEAAARDGLLFDLSSAAKSKGHWPGVKFLCERSGEDGAIAHKVIAVIGETKTPEVSARKLKEAKAKALVEAFSIFANVDSPKWQGEKLVDPIRLLYKYCHEKGFKPPRFSVSMGEDPGFFATCEAAGVHVKSRYMRSKKIAKRSAAAMAINLIKEKDSGFFDG